MPVAWHGEIRDFRHRAFNFDAFFTDCGRLLKLAGSGILFQLEDQRYSSECSFI